MRDPIREDVDEGCWECEGDCGSKYHYTVRRYQCATCGLYLCASCLDDSTGCKQSCEECNKDLGWRAHDADPICEVCNP